MRLVISDAPEGLQRALAEVLAAAAETRPEAAQAASAPGVLAGFDQVSPADLGEVSVVAGASPGGVKVVAIDLRRAGVHVEYRGRPEPSPGGEDR